MCFVLKVISLLLLFMIDLLINHSLFFVFVF